jgi:hypothetical protein
MTSESSGTSFSARIFKFFANIINDIIFSCVSEDQRVTSILKVFTLIYLLKFSNSLQIRKAHFSILGNISNF